jgi:hypothetical protein
MTDRPFTALRVVAATASYIAGELRGVADRRALSPAEATQLATADRLAAALLDARETPAETAVFGEAFGPFLPLFEAADAAARRGGLKVPAEAPAHPWPITPAHLGWYTVLILLRCLAVIDRRGMATPRRRDQFDAATDLAAALAALADDPTSANDPAGPAMRQVEAAFLLAGAVLNGHETEAIVSEVYAAQLAAAPAGSA